MSPRKWEIARSIASAFAKKGYHAVGMRDLAGDLGLNQGTLYHHFHSKDEALLSICLIGQQEIISNCAAVMGTSSIFAERVRDLFAAHLASLGHLGDFIDVYASQWHLVPEPIAEPLQEGWQELRTLFRNLFAEAIALCEIPPDTPIRDATRMLLALFRTVNILHRMGRSAELEAFAGFATKTFLKGLSSPQ